jgi:hypothetical protein
MFGITTGETHKVRVKKTFSTPGDKVSEEIATKAVETSAFRKDCNITQTCLLKEIAKHQTTYTQPALVSQYFFIQAANAGIGDSNSSRTSLCFSSMPRDF